ncbi:hypothetical protein HK097_011442, partial [Rhizophlyctis rosea]
MDTHSQSQSQFPLLLSSLPLTPRPQTQTRRPSLTSKPKTASTTSLLPLPAQPARVASDKKNNPDAFVSVVGTASVVATRDSGQTVGNDGGEKQDDKGEKKEKEEETEEDKADGNDFGEIWKVSKLREGHAGFIRIRVKIDEKEIGQEERGRSWDLKAESERKELAGTTSAQNENS